MNIFVLDFDPLVAAKMHNNKHVVKMILESAQLLCIAHTFTGNDPPYKIKAFKNHPCSIWVRQSINNYRWLCVLAKALCKEYTFRYGKIHKTESVIDWLTINEPKLADLPMTPFAQAMPEEYRNNNAVVAYRRYYIEGKNHLAQWKKRERPKWYVEISS